MNQDSNETYSKSIVHLGNDDSGIASMDEVKLTTAEISVGTNSVKMMELYMVQQQIKELLLNQENNEGKTFELAVDEKIGENVSNHLTPLQLINKLVNATHQDASTQTVCDTSPFTINLEPSRYDTLGENSDSSIIQQILKFHSGLVNLASKVDAIMQLLFVMCGNDTCEVLRNLTTLSNSPENCSLLLQSGIMPFLVRCAYANLEKYFRIIIDINIPLLIRSNKSELVPDATFEEDELNNTPDLQGYLSQFVISDPDECEILAAQLIRNIITKGSNTAASKQSRTLTNFNPIDGDIRNERVQRETKILGLLDPIKLYLNALLKFVLDCMCVISIVREAPQPCESLIMDELGEHRISLKISRDELGRASDYDVYHAKDLADYKVCFDHSNLKNHDIPSPPLTHLSALLKLSYDEEHRCIMGELGGLRAISSIIIFEYFVNGHTSNGSTLLSKILTAIGLGINKCHFGNAIINGLASCRKFCCVILTNLTFSDHDARSFLCSQPLFLQSLVLLLTHSELSIVQMSANLMRNLSWNPKDILIKVALSNPNFQILPTLLTKLKYLFDRCHLPRKNMHSLKDQEVICEITEMERTIKDICAVVWNLTSKHLFINEIMGAWAAFVDVIPLGLTYSSPTNTLDVLENVGGILKNISEMLSTSVLNLSPPIYPLVINILLRHLRFSTSLIVVSNACVVLRNMTVGPDYSAIRCRNIIRRTEGSLQMLARLSWSKHPSIRNGANGILRNITKNTEGDSLILETLAQRNCVADKACEEIRANYISECEDEVRVQKIVLAEEMSFNGFSVEPYGKVFNQNQIIVSVDQIRRHRTNHLFFEQTPMMFSRQSSLSSLTDMSESSGNRKKSNNHSYDKGDIESIPSDMILGCGISCRESDIESSCPSPLSDTKISDLNTDGAYRGLLENGCESLLAHDQQNQYNNGFVGFSAHNLPHYNMYGGQEGDSGPCEGQVEVERVHVYATENTPFLFSSRYSSLSRLEDPCSDVEDIACEPAVINLIGAHTLNDDINDNANDESTNQADLLYEDEEEYEDEFEEGEEDIINACIQSVFPSGKNVFETKLSTATPKLEIGCSTRVGEGKALSDNHFFQRSLKNITNFSMKDRYPVLPASTSVGYDNNSIFSGKFCLSCPDLYCKYLPLSCHDYFEITNSKSSVNLITKPFKKYREMVHSDSQLYRVSRAWPYPSKSPRTHYSNSRIKSGDVNVRLKRANTHSNSAKFINTNREPSSPQEFMPCLSQSTHGSKYSLQKCTPINTLPNDDENDGDNLQVFATEGTPFILSKSNSIQQLLSELSNQSLADATNYNTNVLQPYVLNGDKGDVAVKKGDDLGQEDMIKTYATEGTPYHVTRSPSLESYGQISSDSHVGMENDCTEFKQEGFYNHSGEEELMVFCLEDTPMEFSKRASLSQLMSYSSCLGSDELKGVFKRNLYFKSYSYNELKETFNVASTAKIKRFQSENCILSSETVFNGDEFILAPPPMNVKKAFDKRSSPVHNDNSYHVNHISLDTSCCGINDSPRIYNVEGTPLIYSHQDSYANLLSPLISSDGGTSCDMSINDAPKACLKMPFQTSGVNLQNVVYNPKRLTNNQSRAEDKHGETQCCLRSMSNNENFPSRDHPCDVSNHGMDNLNLSRESLTMDPSPLDQALLDQCIISALPKNISKRNFLEIRNDDLTLDNRVNDVLCNENNFQTACYSANLTSELCDGAIYDFPIKTASNHGLDKKYTLILNSSTINNNDLTDSSLQSSAQKLAPPSVNVHTTTLPYIFPSSDPFHDTARDLDSGLLEENISAELINISLSLSSLSFSSNKFLYTPSSSNNVVNKKKIFTSPSAQNSQQHNHDFVPPYYSRAFSIHSSLSSDDRPLLENETISLISDTDGDDESSSNCVVCEVTAHKQSNSPLKSLREKDLLSKYLAPRHTTPANSKGVSEVKNATINCNSSNLETRIQDYNRDYGPNLSLSLNNTLPKPLIKQRTFTKDSPQTSCGKLLPSIDKQTVSTIVKGVQNNSVINYNLKYERSKSNLTAPTLSKNNNSKTSINSTNSDSNSNKVKAKKGAKPSPIPSQNSFKTSNPCPQKVLKKTLPPISKSFLPTGGLTKNSSNIEKGKAVRKYKTNIPIKKNPSYVSNNQTPSFKPSITDNFIEVNTTVRAASKLTRSPNESINGSNAKSATFSKQSSFVKPPSTQLLLTMTPANNMKFKL